MSPSSMAGLPLDDERPGPGAPMGRTGSPLHRASRAAMPNDSR